MSSIWSYVVMHVQMAYQVCCTNFFPLFQDLLSQTREKQAATLSEVTWRGRTVQVKVETVRLFLLSMTDAEKELEAADTTDSKISIYETLLKQCIEAQQALRDTLQEDTVRLLSAAVFVVWVTLCPWCLSFHINCIMSSVFCCWLCCVISLYLSWLITLCLWPFFVHIGYS